jgi:hypothetical protein
LLATVAALVTHFILLRAPLTTELSTWRGSLGLWYVGTIALIGLGACYIAKTSSRNQSVAHLPAATPEHAEIAR